MQTIVSVRIVKSLTMSRLMIIKCIAAHFAYDGLTEYSSGAFARNAFRTTSMFIHALRCRLKSPQESLRAQVSLQSCACKCCKAVRNMFIHSCRVVLNMFIHSCRFVRNTFIHCYNRSHRRAYSALKYTQHHSLYDNYAPLLMHFQLFNARHLAIYMSSLRSPRLRQCPRYVSPHQIRSPSVVVAVLQPSTSQGLACRNFSLPTHRN
jgi:hypothetical protein